MSSSDFTAAPKPFVFVLMPFDKTFDDIYRFGIKGAADDAGAYAERVDEQNFVEGILDRIINQINKADIVVADMTGRNPNVFYEVGFAHALQKLVLLVTQDVDDIPFDLRHRPHIVYGGEIQKLKEQLAPKIKWAIGEAKRATSLPVGQTLLDVTVLNTAIPEVNNGAELPHIQGTVNGKGFALPILIRNASREVSPGINWVYLVSRPNADVYPVRYETESIPADYGAFIGGGVTAWGKMKQVAYRIKSINVPGSGAVSEVLTRLSLAIPSLPTDAVEEGSINLQLADNVTEATETLRIRFHSAAGTFEYPFRLTIKLREPEREPVEKPPPAVGRKLVRKPPSTKTQKKSR